MRVVYRRYAALYFIVGVEMGAEVRADAAIPDSEPRGTYMLSDFSAFRA